MKLLNTDTEISALAKLVLDARHYIDATLFESKSCDPKYDAQRNLDGRTHYVDEDTLRFHKSRVLGCSVLAGGLLLKVTTSDSLDFQNSARGFRVVVFDVFGTTVVRPGLDKCATTRKAAEKAFEAETLDVVAHYRAALAARAERLANELGAMRRLVSTIDSGIGQAVAA